MPTRTDRALLLKRTPFGESSLVAQVLTREHGRVHLMAKGAYRTTSRFFGVLDFFDTLELTWSHAPRRELDLLTAGDRGVSRRVLAQDLTAYRAALTVLELCELGSRPGQRDPRLYDLGSGALDALVRGTPHPDLTLVVFELRFLQNLGLEPALADCAACGGSAELVSRERRRAAFSAGAGGRLCRRCAEEARRSGRRVGTMPAEVLDTAHRLLSASALALGGEPAQPPPSQHGLPRHAHPPKGLHREVPRLPPGDAPEEPSCVPHRTQPQCARARSDPNRMTRRPMRSALPSPPSTRPLAGILRAFLCACLLAQSGLLVGCGTPSFRPEGVPSEYTAEQVPLALAEARAELDSGSGVKEAFYRMRAANAAPGLSRELKGDVQRTFERAADRYVDSFGSPDANPRAVEEVLEDTLPRRVAVRAGIRAAQLWFGQGERMRAFRLVRRVDREYPRHFERAAAGRLLFDIGTSLANDKGRYGLFFSFSALAPQVLEYLVLEHPSDPHGDQALWILANLYQDKKDFDVAITKHQDLILWFSDSPLRPASEAAIPHLRLESLASPEYDRVALQRARRELETWLGEYPKHELRNTVQADLQDCIQRLADNDLTVGRFYLRVKNPTGAEYHARRAVEEARDGKHEAQIQEAVAFLETVVASREETSD